MNNTAHTTPSTQPQVGTGCQYGISGWGNAERQFYDATPRNIRVRGGRLALRAVHDPASAERPFTSARIRTWGKFSVAPSKQHPTVRIEARMRVPAGAGLWSAFWLSLIHISQGIVR